MWTGWDEDRMRLTSAKVENFRLLEDVDVCIDPLATLVVGRNNSGKTSLVNVFEKFFGEEDGRFVLEDLPAAKISDIKRAREWFAKSNVELPPHAGDQDTDLRAQAIALLPRIVLRLTVTYDEEDNLALLSDMILDLDEDCFTVVIEAVLEADKPEQFLAEYESASRRESFVEDKYLRTHFSRHFKPAYYAVASAGEPSARKALTRAAVRKVLSVKFIYAQNKLDDSGTDRTRNLSKSFEAFHHANSLDEERNQNVEGIDAALATASKRVDENFAMLFEPIFEDLRAFGVQSIAPVQQPRIVTQIDSGAVLRGSTRVEYPAEIGDTSLPEGHNGLGYSKLIFTILQIVGFYEAYRRSVPRPALQLLFVEEPEAHLHPQMQEAFIGNIRAFLDSKAGWNVQVLITTHSSHIVARSGFQSVRYFDRIDSGTRVRDLLNFQASLGIEPDGQETLRFLRQYMELRRCDMFFADKIILIEGTVERLLLPEMIKRCAPDLQHMYISIVEVGGAYALKFKELLGFLGVRTLVVTDLDSGEAAGRHPACAPRTAGAITTNATLKNWLPAEQDVDALLNLDDGAKIHDQVRVTYQVPELDVDSVGRSFEDAFILANADSLAHALDRLATRSAFVAEVGDAVSAEAIADHAYEIAGRLKDTKTDFAFDVLRLDDWRVPRYIEEGLQWLS